MAVFVVTFDSKSKAMTVTRDGAELPNCVGVGFGQSYDDPDEYGCEIVQVEKDEVDDVRTYVRTCAAEAGDEVHRKPGGSAVEDEVRAFFARPTPKRGAGK